MILASQKMLRRRASLCGVVLIALGLCGCVVTHYRKLERGAPSGYTDRELPNREWDVAFHGDESSTPEKVRDFALLRCAEVTLAKGATHFVILRETPTTRRLSWGSSVQVGSSQSSPNISMVTGAASGTTATGGGTGAAAVRRGKTVPVMSLRIKLYGAADGPLPGDAWVAASVARTIRAGRQLR